MSNSIDSLPPEMQARLAQIMQHAQATGALPPPEHQHQHQAPPPPPPAPRPVKQPSLMDHVIALRQEVNALSQQVAANSQVVEAVGGAVGQLYETFQPSEQSVQGPTYSQEFQDQRLSNEDADY